MVQTSLANRRGKKLRGPDGLGSMQGVGGKRPPKVARAPDAPLPPEAPGRLHGRDLQHRSGDGVCDRAQLDVQRLGDLWIREALDIVQAKDYAVGRRQVIDGGAEHRPQLAPDRGVLQSPRPVNRRLYMLAVEKRSGPCARVSRPVRSNSSQSASSRKASMSSCRRRAGRRRRAGALQQYVLHRVPHRGRQDQRDDRLRRHRADHQRPRRVTGDAISSRRPRRAPSPPPGLVV